MLRSGGKPNRVLHVMNGPVGGAADSTLDLIAVLKSHGVESSVVCHTAGTEQERRRVFDAVEGRALFRPLYWWNRKIRAPRWRRPLIELKILARTGCARSSTADVVRYAVEHRAELIHTNTILTPEGGYAARKLGLPHVWHVRELIGPGMPYRFYREGRRFGAFAARYATMMVANSRTTAEKIAAWLPDGLLRVVPNGIDLRRFAGGVARPRRERLVVAMVGNYTPWKKHELFLRAAAEVALELPVEFRYYGHFPAAASAQLSRSADEFGVSGRLRFMGHVADPASFMSEIDVLVHPTDRESFGRIFIEAMAASVPIVAVRGGAACEVVEDGVTGLLAEVDSAEDIARRLETLLRDEALRKQLGEQGRRRAAADYSLDVCVERMLQIYAEASDRVMSRASSMHAVDSRKK